jgi:lipopolysaccharide/colanic/teichoic acid biosynthesis glycosyltransferase
MHNLYRRWGKRLVDLAIAAPALVLAAPLMLAIAALVRFSLGSPVLFRQVRPGKGAHPFTLLKFRTMREAFDRSGTPLPDVERRTPLGQVLRATSLDELPELLNVVRGDMSLVGPRPLLMRYVPFFTARERTRLDVLPGITGLAQINGRNDLNWNDRLELDAQYANRVTFALDLGILIRTPLKVLFGRNVQTVPRLAMQDLDEERS